MRLIAIMLCACLGFISGCKNKSNDSRDKFVGAWKGAVTISVPDFSINEIVSKTETVTKTGHRRITFTDLSDPADVKHAVADGRSIVFDESRKKMVKDGRLIVLLLNGKGKLTGSSLTVIGTAKASSEGKSASGTWTMTAFKQ